MAHRRLPDALPRPCRHCLKQFVPERKYPNQVYCSVRCQREKFLPALNGGNAELSRRTVKARADKMRDRGEGKSYRKRDGRHEHRLVMEQILGRPLAPGEVVHHKDGNKRNNDPANLELLASQAVHAGIHNPKQDRRCTLPGCERPHHGHGLCLKHRREQKRREAGIPPRARRTCTETECGRPAVGRGFCGKHWQQWRKTQKGPLS